MLPSIRLGVTSAFEIVGAAARVPGRGKAGKERFKHAINRVYARCEEAGLLPRLPAFDEAYRDYPELRAFEQNYAEIRSECEALLRVRDGLTDVAALGGDYTSGGIHTIQWKALMLKSGHMIDENCKLAPATARILRGLPNVYNAFFSILEPHQYIKPHWGYYKGFVRFHLAVVIPDDNAREQCWLRVNANPRDNAPRDKALVERGEKYYWHNGRGVVFDDTNLHDAANESDRVRVVLWLDVARKMPRPLALYNQAVLYGLYNFEPTIRRIAQKARVDLGTFADPGLPG